MKNDARLLLNKKKWKKGTGNSKPDIWKSRGAVDARKILNLKRNQKSKQPALGSYMRTKTATALIASRIMQEISPPTRAHDKHVQIKRDGNIVVTKLKNVSQVSQRQMSLPKRNIGLSSVTDTMESMQFEPSSSDIDDLDLEHTAVDDLLDFEALPPAYVASKSVSNLSRKSAISQVLEKRHTMIADQLGQFSGTGSVKVYVFNLHPSVSKEDVMELFGEIGMIRAVEMIKPGTATIDFYDVADAEKAVDIYHNRLLDGLPMKCYMESDPQIQRSLSQRLGQRVASYTPAPQSISSSSSSVLTNSRSRYNPRNVQFTVKLT